MDRIVFFLIFFLGCTVPKMGYAQEDQKIMEEESAAVFLEDYSDAFQENFFEALKQKGIQNYDKAIIYLLECKKIQPENDVVAHELAKTYSLDKKNVQAQEYGIEALLAKPENYWYLNTLVSIMKAQGGTMDMVKNRIPWDNQVLKKNLMHIYYKQGAYKAALTIIDELPKLEKLTVLKQTLNDSIQQQNKNKTVSSFTLTNNNSGTNDVEQYKTRIKGLMRTDNFAPVVLQVSSEALDKYPTQPYFYYTNGYALNRSNKSRQAIEILEAGLDYIISDISLENKIYKELSDAYNAINNPSKANMYLSRIKPGF